MKFNYKLTKKDMIKFLFKKHRTHDYIYLMLFTFVYMFLIFRNITSYINDSKPITISFITIFIYIIGLVLLYIILRVINYLIVLLKVNSKGLKNAYGLYKCEIDDKGIRENINDQSFDLKWNEIKKIEQNKKIVIVSPKHKDFILVFQKGLFTVEKKYDELIDIIKEYRNKNNL